MLKLLIIKIKTEFDFAPYLYIFPVNIRLEIMALSQHSDKAIAFTSALLKYHYLPNLLNSPLKIQLNRYGKPYLVDYPNIDFSISHSGEYVVMGIKENGQIGVDLELINKDIDLSISSLAFSTSECRFVDTYMDFFILWTKKEAYLKCLGTGFMEESMLNTAFNNNLDEAFDSYQFQSIIFDEKYILSICISE